MHNETHNNTTSEEKINKTAINHTYFRAAIIGSGADVAWPSSCSARFTSLKTVASSTVAGKMTCRLRAKSAIDLRMVLPALKPKQ